MSLSLSDYELGQRLWEHALAKARRDIQSRHPKRLADSILESDIITELDSYAKIPEMTYRGWNRTKRGVASKTQKKLLKYLGFKSLLLFREHIELEEKKKGNVYQWVKEIIADNDFLNDVYDLIATSPVLANSDSSLNHNQAVLFFKLIDGVKEAYCNEQIFTSLHLVADPGGVFGNLSMEDYFIQLSYVTQLELSTRESIIRSETEINKRKLQRALENHAQLTKDYIVNYSLQNVDNLLILGSPGIGKSTFTRWLSYAWSDNPNLLGGKIPIYIQLKGLIFNSAVNPIVDYILKNYLADEVTASGSMHSLMHNASSIVCFILDGYDELSEKSKEALYYRLQEISSNAKYILTSRPYGILNTYGLRWKQMIQLDGFDNSNINNYIDVFLRKNNLKKRKTKEKLLEIIKTNPTLADFSHNPLMLSFIVYIYLADNEVEETFQKIQTRFDLQEVVINWMYSHNKRKIPVSINSHLVTKASSLACNMELDKIPEISGSIYDENVTSLLVPLSRLGIGQYYSENSRSFKFSFSSITFQEYFAAIHIGNIITPKAFSYLLQDSYYWNLTAMLVGKLNRDANYVAINQLLADCRNEMLKQNSYYSYYKYLLLLGECSSKYLNDYLQSQSLYAVYTAYKLNIHNDRIKYSVTEYIQRFYGKISLVNKAEFKGYITADLKKAAGRELVNWRGTDPYYYIRTLIADLALADDSNFLVACFDILISVMKNIAKKKEEYLKMTNTFEIPRLPEAILSMLKSVGDHGSISVEFSKQIETVKRLLLIHHLTYKAEIEQLLFSKIDDIVNKLEISIGKLKVVANNDEVIGDIAICMFLLGKHCRQLQTNKGAKNYIELFPAVIKIIKQFITNANELDQKGTLKGNYNYWHYIAFVDQVAQLTVAGLLEHTDSFDCFKAALDILNELSYSSMTVNVDQISANFEKLLSNTNQDLGQNLRYIHLSLLYVPALRNKVAVYRNQLFNLINKYIGTHQDAFQEDEPIYPIDCELHPIELISPFFSLLSSDRHSTTEIIYESDKRFFVTRLITEGKGNYNFLRSAFANVLDYNFVLYDLLIWNYVIEYLNPQDRTNIEYALNIYTNPSIYQYSSNVKYLLIFLDFLTSIESTPLYQTILRQNSDLVFTISARALLMAKVNKGVNAEQNEKIIYLIGRIMTHRSLSNLYKKNYANALFSSMLQYYFTSDVQYCNLIQYDESKDNSQLIENVYTAFSLTKDVALIEKFGGKKFMFEVRDYHEQIKIYHFPFLRSKFESLCAK